MSEQQNDFTNVGAFKIDNQFATSIRYEVDKGADDNLSGSLSFLNGRKQVAKEPFSSKDELISLVGDKNADSIISNVGASKTSTEEKMRGKLQAEDLVYMEKVTKEPVNEIEQGMEREQDERLRQFLELQRQDMRRIRKEMNIPGFDRDRDDKPEEGSSFSSSDTKGKDNTSQDVGADGIPSVILSRYIKNENKYHYPDQSVAFEDKGKRLSTRSENKQLIKDLISISESRGWDSIRVRGSEEFRRSAWFEASQRGLEVTGYKPTEVEKAHLISILEKQGKELPEQQKGGRSNSIEMTNVRNKEQGTEQGKAIDQTEQEPPLKPGVHRGVLLDHGKDFYNHDKKESESYYARIQTEKGERELWGQDLSRAISESGAEKGDKVDLEFKGKKPVTVDKEIKDDSGKVIGHEKIETHRSTWSVEKVQVFNQEQRSEALKKHPELASSYVTMKAAEKFAAKQWPDDPEMQNRFTGAVKETLSKKMEAGERIPTPAVTRVKQPEKEQQASAEKAKNHDKDMGVYR